MNIPSSNITTESPDKPGGYRWGDAVLLVPGDPWFLAVHISALISLNISIVVSGCTIVYLIRNGTERNIFKRKIGERMVLYLAICDLLYSVEHTSNHVITVLADGDPGDLECAISGFFLHEFLCAQSVIVLFSGFSTYMLVVHGVKLNFGKFDWRMLIPSYGLPALTGAVLLYYGLMGTSGFWCLVDVRKANAPKVYNIYSGIMLLTNFMSVYFYAIVWIKIAKTSKMLTDVGNQSSKASDKSYSKTAKIMVLFCITYFTQWWAFTLFSLWANFETPHVMLVVLVVIFSNLGGVFNFFAYTFVRKIYAIGSSGKSKKRRKGDDEEISMATKTMNVSESATYSTENV